MEAGSNQVPEKLDPKLASFLDEVRLRFLNGQALNLESTIPEILPSMNPTQLNALVTMTREHFAQSVCHNHKQVIVNDEAYAENTNEGEPEEGPIVDFEITSKNLESFLTREGSNSLIAHIRAQVPEHQWKEIETVMVKRALSAKLEP